MLNVLGPALLCTIGTVLFVGICGLIAAAVCYVLDNWDDFSDTFKALGVVLLVYLFWCIVIGGYKYTHTVTIPPSVEVTAELDDV